MCQFLQKLKFLLLIHPTGFKDDPDQFKLRLSWFCNYRLPPVTLISGLFPLYLTASDSPPHLSHWCGESGSYSWRWKCKNC